MVLKLENVDPSFRQITDLLLFSDNTNIDLNNYFNLLKLNYNYNLEYFTDRFEKACNIYWESSFEVWYFRLNFLFDLQDKSILNRVCAYLESRMYNLSRRKTSISCKYDVEFSQFLTLCQVKKHRNESLDFAQKFLEELPFHYRVESTIEVVKQFVPIVYDSIEEYAEVISKKIYNSSKNFVILKALDKQGIKYSRDWLIGLTNSLIIERANSDKNRRLFLELINDKEILAGIKARYSSLHKAKLVSMLASCDYYLLEGSHLQNIKNLLDLDSTVVQELVDIYITKLYARQISHMRSNADRLIKLIEQVPEISPRVVLSSLSSKKQLSDIKYILPHFPEIKNLTAFL